MNLSALFRLFPLLVVIIATSIPKTVNADGDGDKKCATSVQFQCPYLTDLCNKTIYVKDCMDCDGYFSTDSQQDLCFDRKLLSATANPSPSYLWRDIVGMIVWFIAAGVATACGVGGGGIYVPLGILLLWFAPKPSSGLSQASIFGASLGGLFLNIRDKHPFTVKVQKGNEQNQADILSSVPSTDHSREKNDDSVQYFERPLIDYDMALFLAPMEMAGAVLGVLIQKILPNWLYLLLAAVILGFTAYKTYGKFLDTRQKEKAARQQERGELPESAPQGQQGVVRVVEKKDSLPPAKTNDSSSTNEEEPLNGVQVEQEPEPVDETLFDQDKVARRQFLLERDQRRYPAEKLFALFILWIGLILLTFLKGGKGVESIVGIDCTSPWYGILIAIQFLWTFGFATFFAFKLMKATEEKVAVGYPFHPQDVLWDSSRTKFFAFFTFVAGIIAGLIGVGGGMILGPLMLVMGIHPRVSSATTATMIVLTSSSVAILFVTAGQVPWEYAVTFFFVCLFGALLGKAKIDGYVKRTGKASLLILLLSLIIGFSTLGCLVIVFKGLSAAGWCFAGFNQFCSVSADHSDEDVCVVNRLLFGTQ